MIDLREDVDAALEWARELDETPHHSRCASLAVGNRECDCYKTTRLSYQVGRGILELERQLRVEGAP